MKKLSVRRRRELQLQNRNEVEERAPYLHRRILAVVFCVLALSCRVLTALQMPPPQLVNFFRWEASILPDTAHAGGHWRRINHSLPFSCGGQAPFWHRSLVRVGWWMPAIVFFSSFRSIGSLASPGEKCAKPIGAGSEELFMQGIILCSYSLTGCTIPPLPPSAALIL